MSKKSRTKKHGRKPSTFRVELTDADFHLLNEAFGRLIDGPSEWRDPPTDQWIVQLMDLEEKKFQW